MMYFVYLLYSLSSGKIYCGYTMNLERRLQGHNVTESKGYTLRYRPWVLFYQEEYTTKAMAMERERYFKTGRGSVKSGP
jgi:putative endonuclease